MEKFLIKCLNQTIDLSLNSDQVNKIIRYLDLMKKWNKVYNLTAITDPKEMIIKHIMDSLVIGPYLKGESFADIGSGAGLPGIPLSILYPEKKFILIDSRSKRTIFLNQVKFELKLNNVQVINKRAEEIGNIKLDGVFSRAFSSLSLFNSIGRKLIKESGTIYAMKGIINEDELNKVKYLVKKIIKLNIPGEECSRNLVLM